MGRSNRLDEEDHLMNLQSLSQDFKDVGEETVTFARLVHCWINQFFLFNKATKNTGAARVGG